MEPYLEHVKNIKHRSALSRFRLSSHCLQIEKGRHERPRVDIADRLCHKCNTLEDEYHFLVHCQVNMPERQVFFSHINAKDNYFNSLTDYDIFIYLMKNDNPQVLTWLGKFLHESFLKRESMLSITA